MGDSLSGPKNQGTKHSKRSLNFARDEQATSSSVDVNANLNRVVQRLEIRVYCERNYRTKQNLVLLSYWKNGKVNFQPLDSIVRYYISRRNTHLLRMRRILILNR